jgi:hypothetical protein
MTLTRETILIAVKTYPTLSRRYVETVCTAGVTAAGEWRRLYPIEFRYIEQQRQYRLFDIVNVETGPSKDARPETRKPNSQSLQIVRQVSDWPSRRDWISPTIVPSIKALQEGGRTIGAVAVKKVLEFEAKPVSDQWSEKQLAELDQDLLFEKRKVLEKIPFEFRLLWGDYDNVQHDHLFISWEVCQTFRSYRTRYGQEAIARMKEKWMNDLLGPSRDISFFMGNMFRFPQNFLICGTFSPPRMNAQDSTQGALF